MPLCKKCDKYFSIKFEIDGVPKLSGNRKYCLKCSPYGAHNTKRLEFLDTRTSKSQTLVVKECSICRRKFNRKGSVCPSCAVNYKRFGLKKRMVEFKGGKCQRCGYDKNLKALQFHHIDPSNKFFTISLQYCRKWEVLEKELEKCILLCSNCHVEISDHELLKTNLVRQYWEKDQQYVKPEPKGLPKCIDCGKEIDRKATRCNKCHHIRLRRVPWPTKEELARLVWEKSTSQLAKDFGVSDKAIEKWCKSYEIAKPPRGYWAKKAEAVRKYMEEKKKNG